MDPFWIFLHEVVKEKFVPFVITEGLDDVGFFFLSSSATEKFLEYSGNRLEGDGEKFCGK